LKFVVERCPDGRYRLRHKHKRCDKETHDRVRLGNLKKFQPILDATSYLFRQKNDTCQSDK
jgi:hypothetical protein